MDFWPLWRKIHHSQLGAGAGADATGAAEPGCLRSAEADALNATRLFRIAGVNEL
jgi:hypothetical protein